MPPTTDLDYIHKFLPAEAGSSHPVTLLLLHGTGGDENALLSLGKELWPGAALLGLRGKVLETGTSPSFRRFTEVGVEDVKSRTQELAQFIDAASERYGFRKRKLIVVGYSNGANLAASLILLHPHYLTGAVLFRAMVPLVPDLIRDFSHLSVFIGAARLDPLTPSGQAEELAALLESGGADVSISWHQGGRELTEDDVQAAKHWLTREKHSTKNRRVRASGYAASFE
jgi:phospholipase/carboxylesterase/glyoxalase family protein